METQTLSVKAFAKAGGFLWGGTLLWVGLVNLAVPGYGDAFLEMMGSLYFWHPAGHSLMSALVFGAIGVVDGAIGALFFAVLYNMCLKGCSAKKCAES